MNTKLILGAVIAATTTFAMAGEAASPTRAEVRADAVAWLRSGMATLVSSDSYQPNSPEGKQAYAKYERLRAGSEFRTAATRQQ